MAKDKDNEEELTLPKGRAKMVAYPAGKQPIVTIPEKATITGKTLKVSFRASRQNLRDVEEHMDRMCEETPGVVFLATDSIRDLITRGAAAFREDERRNGGNDE